MDSQRKAVLYMVERIVDERANVGPELSAEYWLAVVVLRLHQRPGSCTELDVTLGSGGALFPSSNSSCKHAILRS